MLKQVVQEKEAFLKSLWSDWVSVVARSEKSLVEYTIPMNDKDDRFTGKRLVEKLAANPNYKNMTPLVQRVAVVTAQFARLS